MKLLTTVEFSEEELKKIENLSKELGWSAETTENVARKLVQDTFKRLYEDNPALTADTLFEAVKQLQKWSVSDDSEKPQGS